MANKQSKLFLFIFLAANLVLLALNIEMYEDTSNLSVNLEQKLSDRNAEVQELNSEVKIYQHELADTKEQLLIRNWQLGQIEARSEGVRYQEGDAK